MVGTWHTDANLLCKMITDELCDPFRVDITYTHVDVIDMEPRWGLEGAVFFFNQTKIE